MSNLFVNIKIDNLKHTYPNGTAAINSLSLQIKPGELFGIIGADGAGKTTTMRCMAGVINPTGGTITVNGVDVLANKNYLQDIIGYMPQKYSLYGDLSIAENLQFFADLFCLEKAEFTTRKNRLLSITRLEKFTSRRADALSGGMYKKLALSCALLHKPRILLLDEPTNGVDPVSRIELWDLLAEFLSDNMTIIVNTSYLDEAARCNRVGFMHNGNILLQGNPNELVQKYHGNYEAMFLNILNEPQNGSAHV